MIRFIFLQLPTLLGLFLPSFRCVVGGKKQGETLTRVKGGDVGKRFHSGAYPLQEVASYRVANNVSIHGLRFH